MFILKNEFVIIIFLFLYLVLLRFNIIEFLSLESCIIFILIGLLDLMSNIDYLNKNKEDYFIFGLYGELIFSIWLIGMGLYILFKVIMKE